MKLAQTYLEELDVDPDGDDFTKVIRRRDELTRGATIEEIRAASDIAKRHGY